jgi:hypothetical protein
VETGSVRLSRAAFLIFLRGKSVGNAIRFVRAVTIARDPLRLRSGQALAPPEERLRSG